MIHGRLYPLDSFDLEEDAEKSSRLYGLLKRRGFFWPSYEIYGGVAGFYDLGPMGARMRENLESLWKRRFVIDEGFMEIDCPSVAPEVVFKHSGHLEKFTDYLTRCEKCNKSWRADHLLEGLVENPDALAGEELEDSLSENEINCPDCGGELGPVEEFNLMFKTNIGPGKDKVGYLRPETAQMIFLNFNLLYRLNRNRMPFGVIQIGRGFRNEISPRQGLIRLREFHMAEAEFFFDPEEESYPPFSSYSNMVLNLILGDRPDEVSRISLGEAVEKGTIRSEFLAHFMGSTYDFMLEVGIPEDQIRFRQHLKNEMAHYARDCWDLEVMTSAGWVEMVGVADRSAYDLTQHTRGSGIDLKAQRRFDDPVEKRIHSVTGDMKRLGPLFRGKAKEVSQALSELDPAHVENIIDGGDPVEIEIAGEKLTVPPDAVSIEDRVEKVHTEDYVPYVIEPSFGIDRILTAVLEHSYHEADSSPMADSDQDEEYRVMRLKADMAPVKCGIFPLVNKDGLPEIADEIGLDLKKEGFTTYYDHSGSIGRRYARMDEIGTPYCVTVDHDSRDDGKVTLRERDTGEQARIPIGSVPHVLGSLILCERTFDSFLN